MANVRAKFVVNSVTYRQHWQDKSKRIGTVELNVVSGGSDEDKGFFAATPGGSIKLDTVNQAAIDALPLGTAVYVDLTPVEG
jgi:hypothetical protein